MIEVGIAEEVNNPTDEEQFVKDLQEHIIDILGDDKFIYLEYIDDEYGEPV